jgi:RimJ/RimL family protein N-acetyltransferase
MAIDLESPVIGADLIRIRAVEDTDRAALLALNEQASDRSLYRRFFVLNRPSADAYVDELLRPRSADHQVLVGLVDGELVGVASYERTRAACAEIAVLIEDRYQHMGVGTHLIAELADTARRNNINQLVADVLTGNSPMIAMVGQLGLPTSICAEGDTVVMSLELEPAARDVSATGT